MGKVRYVYGSPSLVTRLVDEEVSEARMWTYPKIHSLFLATWLPPSIMCISSGIVILIIDAQSGLVSPCKRWIEEVAQWRCDCELGQSRRNNKRIRTRFQIPNSSQVREFDDESAASPFMTKVFVMTSALWEKTDWIWGGRRDEGMSAKIALE